MIIWYITNPLKKLCNVNTALSQSFLTYLFLLTFECCRVQIFSDMYIFNFYPVCSRLNEVDKDKPTQDLIWLSLIIYVRQNNPPAFKSLVTAMCVVVKANTGTTNTQSKKRQNKGLAWPRVHCMFVSTQLDTFGYKHLISAHSTTSM